MKLILISGLFISPFNSPFAVIKPLILSLRKIFKLDNWVLLRIKLELIFPKFIPLLSNQYGMLPDNCISGFKLSKYPRLPFKFILLIFLFKGTLRLKSEIKVP